MKVIVTPEKLKESTLAGKLMYLKMICLGQAKYVEKKGRNDLLTR